MVEHLASYEVNAETLGALQDEIDAVLGGLKEPKRTIASKEVATQNLDTLFDETARLFGQIDRVVFALRKKHPDLHARHRAASVVVDPPRRRRANDAAPAPAAQAAT